MDVYHFIGSVQCGNVFLLPQPTNVKYFFYTIILYSSGGCVCPGGGLPPGDVLADSQCQSGPGYPPPPAAVCTETGDRMVRHSRQRRA